MGSLGPVWGRQATQGPAPAAAGRGGTTSKGSTGNLQVPVYDNRDRAVLRKPRPTLGRGCNADGPAGCPAGRGVTSPSGRAISGVALRL